MSRWMILSMLVVVAMAMYAAQQSKPVSSSASKQMAGDGQVQRITLPQYPAQIAPGPNVEVYKKNCLTCHTTRYVSMQPGFAKAVWQSEVKKMVEVYGAPISDADQTLIVEYLVAVKGVEATPVSGVATK